MNRPRRCVIGSTRGSVPAPSASSHLSAFICVHLRLRFLLFLERFHGIAVPVSRQPVATNRSEARAAKPRPLHAMPCTVRIMPIGPPDIPHAMPYTVRTVPARRGPDVARPGPRRVARRDQRPRTLACGVRPGRVVRIGMQSAGHCCPSAHRPCRTMHPHLHRPPTPGTRTPTSSKHQVATARPVRFAAPSKSAGAPQCASLSCR